MITKHIKTVLAVSRAAALRAVVQLRCRVPGARPVAQLRCRVPGGFAVGLLALLCSCSDWRHGLAPEAPGADAIALTATVAPARSAVATRSPESTRADGSIVNRLETLLPTGNDYRVGLFAYYTGQQTWQQAAAAATDPSGSVPGGLPAATAPTLMFNQPATVGLNADKSANTLDYTPLRFWPNNRFTPDGATTEQYEYCSFWAYYPWNATTTGTVGDYGIGINTDGINSQGITLNFTMHPDAAEQNDFLLSDFVADRSRSTNPLNGDEPTPVPLRLHHLLAQVRVYAFIVGVDRVEYRADADGNTLYADDTWFDRCPVYTGEAATAAIGADGTITDDLGNTYVKTGADAVYDPTIGLTINKQQFLALHLPLPDEESTNTVRWKRLDNVWNIGHKRRRADITYSLELNNLRTACTFNAAYDAATRKTAITYTDATTLGSATVSNYIMNPYWFRFKDGEREMLNTDYMYDDFEQTAAYRWGNTGDATVSALTADEQAAAEKQDGIAWGASDPLDYLKDEQGSATSQADALLYPADYHDEAKRGHHYNFAPGNILLVVPQKVNDEDVPNIVITARGKDTRGNDVTARVTVNLLQMNIKWESGFIYCYAFIDELQPGDDKVRGPETITVVFDPTRHTDQW